MVQIPEQLTWELTRRSNCFLRKKNGKTKRSGTVCFSVEPGNLASLNQLKYSGLSNHKTIDVVCDDKKAILIKKSAKAAKKSGLARIPLRRPFARSVKVMQSQTSDVYYRRDLQKAALGKYTAVYQANRRAAGVVKGVPVKKGRGSINAEEEE